MKKRTIQVHIRKFKSTSVGTSFEYKVVLHYAQGDQTFTHDNDGKGMTLGEAQHLAFVMRDCLLPEVRDQ